MAVSCKSWRLHSPEHPVVFMVRADPKPHDVGPINNTESTVVRAYARRVNWPSPAHALEIQARMVGA